MEKAQEPQPLRSRLLLALYNAEDRLNNDDPRATAEELDETIDTIKDIEIPTDLKLIVFKLYALRADADAAVLFDSTELRRIQENINRILYYVKSALILHRGSNSNWSELTSSLDSYENMLADLVCILESSPSDRQLENSLTLIDQIALDIPNLITEFVHSKSVQAVENPHQSLEYLSRYLEGTVRELEAVSINVPNEVFAENSRVAERLINIDHAIEKLIRINMVVVKRQDLLVADEGGVTGKRAAQGFVALLDERLHLMHHQRNMLDESGEDESYRVTAESIQLDCIQVLEEDREFPTLSRAQRIEVLYSLGISNVILGNLKAGVGFFHQCINLDDPQDLEINRFTIDDAIRLTHVCSDDSES